MKSAIKKVGVHATNTLKRAMGLGESKKYQTRQSDEMKDEDIEALRYLYGDDFDNNMEAACQEVHKDTTDPVKLATLEIHQVEDSLATLVGRMQLLPNAENPFESGAIEEELNRLLFRLDDIETRGDANLKEIRTRSLKQVKGALQNLSVCAPKKDKSPDSSVCSSEDFSVPFETVEYSNKSNGNMDDQQLKDHDTTDVPVTFGIGEETIMEVKNKNFPFPIASTSSALQIDTPTNEDLDTFEIREETSVEVEKKDPFPIASTSSAPQIDTLTDEDLDTFEIGEETIMEVEKINFTFPIASTSSAPQIDTPTNEDLDTFEIREETIMEVENINFPFPIASTSSALQIDTPTNEVLDTFEIGEETIVEVEKKDPFPIASTSSAPQIDTLADEDLDIKTTIDEQSFEIVEHFDINLLDSQQIKELDTYHEVKTDEVSTKIKEKNAVQLSTSKIENLEETSNMNTVQQKNEQLSSDGNTNIASAYDNLVQPSGDLNVTHQYPVQLLTQDSKGHFSLNEQALMQILGHESVKHRKLAVISIVGDFRRGKSFLLNFILRYLQADGASNWLEGENENLCNELKGFSWQGGMERDTTGILMWSKPFLIGDDHAVVLVDTQGTYDSKTSMKESSFIFTLSTLMSSVQIFNILERIQMDDLTNLQHFLEFGRTINKSCGSKVFEKFIFLVRDWKFPKQLSFGFNGGRMLLTEWFKNQASSDQAQMINTCFEKVECFLMPHPGEKVSWDECFKGDLNDIRPEFLTHLKTFVESIIQDICVKKISESFLLAGDFVAYVKIFIERLQHPKFEPKSLMTTFSDIMLEKARKEAESFYTQEMESQLRVCGNLTELHHTTLDKALQIFDDVYPFERTEVSNARRNILKEVLTERSKHLLHRVVDDEVSAAFNQYQTYITALCNRTGSNSTNSLSDAHEKASKLAYKSLKTRLTPLVDKKQYEIQLAALKKKTQELCTAMEPVYEVNVRKEHSLQQQVRAMQVRFDLSDVARRVVQKYRSAMDNHCMYSNLMSRQLLEKHKQEKKYALSAFQPLLKVYSLNECKGYIDQAKWDIEEYYTQLQNHQQKKYKDALTEAYTSVVRKYQERMDSLKLDEKPVLDLFTYHETARLEAMANFLSFRDDGSEMYARNSSKISKELEEKFKLYHRMNEKSKKLAEDKELLKLNSEMKNAAHDYQSEMIKRCNTDNSHLELFKHHVDIREKCIANFKLAVAECNSDKTATALEALNEEIEFLYHNVEESEARKLSLLREKEHKRTGKKNYPIGIDLGTTNCCVAVYEEGRVKIMVNNIGKTTTPSTVYFENGGHTFGEPAIVRGFADPRNCISEMKRIIGRKFNDKIVQSLKKRWCFQVSERDGDPVVNVTKGNQRKLLPEEISGLVLGEMKRLASIYLDSEVFDAVVTIPAYFNETQREATKRACNLAGINVLRIINEPTAAAIAYGLQTDVDSLRTVLVFDFGGGTCDVSILEMERGRFIVRASQGDNQLGGEDFDDNLTKYLASIYQHKTRTTLKNTDMRRLRRQCEKAKRDLTDYTECEVHVEMTERGAVDLKEKITRKKFDEINKDLYPRVLVPVKSCLESAQLEVEEIDEVVLVGGSSRMKKIQDLLKGFFPDIEIKIRINPDEAIAYGAAIQAALSSGLYGDKLLHVVDITPISLGIGCKEGDNEKAYSIITPRNTELPSKCSHRYSSCYDNQDCMSVRVYQGEHTKNEFLNTKIGEFTLHGLTKAPAGETKVDVTFEIDEDGILEVTARESSNRSNSRSVRITKCVK